MKKLLALLIMVTMAGNSIAQQTSLPDALMLRFPDVSSDEITFVYAEDVWLVPIDGGIAKRITSTRGMEYFPKFSPDGKTIAFTANYDGNNDVYTISHQGFNLNRLTFHPGGDMVVDWNPKGSEILFASKRKSPSGRFNQFYTISKEGGNSEQLPLFYAELGSYNSDGSKLAYQYLSRVFRTWKRYQGGTASDILIYDFKTKKSEQITTYKGTDALPMWNGNKIYFLSDRGPKNKANIWSYDTKNSSFKQETNFEEYDVKFPSVGPKNIVFENGGNLYLYNLASGSSAEVEIQVPSEHIQARPAWKDLSKNIRSYFISPTGKRALFDARGEIFTVPAEHGMTQNLTLTSGVSEQSPNWSPDGKYIAYFSDKSGEYQLMMQSADGKGASVSLTHDLEHYYSGTLWSPDSKKIAFQGYDGTVYYITVESKKIARVDRGEVSDIRDYKWSPDSKWLVYSKATNSQGASITVYHLTDGSVHTLTSNFYNCSDPVFSADSKYLFYTSDRNFSPVYSSYDGTWVYANSTVIMAAALSKDDPSVVAPKNDVEEIKTGEEKEDEADKKKKSKKSKKDDEEKENGESEELTIDFDGFEKRATQISVKAGNYGSLSATEGKILFVSAPLSAVGNGQPSLTLKFWDIEEQEEKTIISGLTGYELSADGKKILYGTQSGVYAIIDVAEGQKPGDGKVSLKDMKAEIDPRAEWNQIFDEAWRLERDFFYDANMHQVDWEEVKRRYGKLMPFCSSRSDLNYIIGEMIGELNVGHAYVRGGDMLQPKKIGVGMLGADISTNGEKAIRIDKIYHGAPWDVNVRSPLNDPGVKVSEGEYIVAINHQPLDGSKNPYRAFQNLDGKVVTLSVSSSPGMNDVREIDVKLMGNESRLRNLDWIEINRQKVLAATNGECGYIYVPNTGIQGQNELFRMYQGQSNMHAMIIDERWNSGGQIPDRFVELLNRPIRSYFSRRNLTPMPIPFNGMTGPRVMLANQWAGSGGDMFPYIFKQEKVGPIVGKRTWGGLVGISGIPPLVDGGFLTSPNFAFFNLDGQWDVEGYGVDPDYEVDNMPEDVFNGIDKQLDKALELINKSLIENPPKKVKVPVFPDKSGIGNN